MNATYLELAAKGEAFRICEAWAACRSQDYAATASVESRAPRTHGFSHGMDLGAHRMRRDVARLASTLVSLDPRAKALRHAGAALP